jgi:hypothetical protein
VKSPREFFALILVAVAVVFLTQKGISEWGHDGVGVVCLLVVSLTFFQRLRLMQGGAKSKLIRAKPRSRQRRDWLMFIVAFVWVGAIVVGRFYQQHSGPATLGTRCLEWAGVVFFLDRLVQLRFPREWVKTGKAT